MSGNKREHRKTERGSSMIEFCFTIPTLLFIAGATVDLSRYMRYAQVTAFVSQETASQIYRHCSDLTIYQRPVLGSTAVTIDVPNTRTAVAQCIQRIQAASQLVLNRTLGNSAVSSSVYRWQIAAVGAPTCDGTPGAVTEISVQGDTTPSLTENTNDTYLRPITSDTQNSSTINTQPVAINTSQSDVTSPTAPSPTIVNSLQTRSLSLTTDGIIQNGQTTPLVTTQGICSRGRVVTVEVAYAFSPIVKFLPNMMLNLDTMGRRRDISIL